MVWESVTNGARGGTRIVAGIYMTNVDGASADSEEALKGLVIKADAGRGVKTRGLEGGGIVWLVFPF